MGEKGTWGRQNRWEEEMSAKKKKRNSRNKTWKDKDAENMGWRNPDGMENEKPSYSLRLSFQVRTE